MRVKQELIVPYVSYITLGIVAVVIVVMVSFKLVARDNRFLSDSELYIYSRPELNQRKNNANKKQRPNTFLAPKSTTTSDSITTLD
jgi:hypothetical protein